MLPCHALAAHPHSFCRNRHCPKCQGAAAKDWLAARAADLLPVPYFHLVFTLPAAIADLAYQNKAVIYDLLFKASSEALLTIAADPKHLGARIGATAVLHTWGSAMTHHPHVHMIVPGGGIALDSSQWVACKPGFFLPVRVLSKLFRRLLLEKLAAAHAVGRLTFFGEHAGPRDPKAFAAQLAPLRKKNWFIYAKPPFAGPQAVLAYLARYTHRVAVSNRRLVALNTDGVTFRYKGLPSQRAGAIPDPDPRARRVHPALPAPRPAQGFPPHPPLRAPRERRAPGEHCPCQGVARRTRAANGARRDDQGHRHGANRPSSAMPVLRRAHDRHRDLRARRPPARPASARTRDQDRGRMTPKNPSSHRKPAGGHRHQRQADRTLIHPILRPGPPIAPTSTGLGAWDRTPRYLSRDLSADQAIQRLHRTRPQCRLPPWAPIKSP